MRASLARDVRNTKPYLKSSKFAFHRIVRLLFETGPGGLECLEALTGHEFLPRPQSVSE